MNDAFGRQLGLERLVTAFTRCHEVTISLDNPLEVPALRGAEVCQGRSGQRLCVGLPASLLDPPWIRLPGAAHLDQAPGSGQLSRVVLEL
jgi:hypothetical protein